MLGCPFIGLEGLWVGRATEGNEQRQWCANMVVEAAISGGDRPGWRWGVMRGGCSGHFRSRRGRREVARHAR
jgi:hypothetical protein